MTHIDILASIAQRRSNLIGAAYAVVGVICFSLNDVSIKFLSGGYALHQIVLIRSVIGLVLLLLVVLPLTHGWAVLRTQRPGMHVLRGCCVVFANMCFFLGLSVMPIADAVAVFFVSPLLITAFSVIFLKETVGPWRWAAVGIGLAGVAVMLRPGGGSFQVAALFPLAAAFGYASLHMLTRRIGGTESAATMSVYIQLSFVVISGAIGLALGDGRHANEDGGMLAFLVRAWIWPDPRDYWIFALIGMASALGGYMISQAYRISEAAFAAPFEYVAMPMAVLWGVLIFGTWPDAVAWIGMTLIVGAGLFMLWRETLQGRRAARTTPLRR